MRTILKLAATATVAAMPLTAMAATVTQNFNSIALAEFGAQGSSYTAPDGFITVASTGGDVWIGLNSIGVEGPPTFPLQNAIINNGESLLFTFSSLVTDVSFTKTSRFFSGILTTFNEIGDEIFTISSAFPLQLPTTGINGPNNTPLKSFLIEGVFGTAAGITSITYTTVDTPAPVPLPAAGLLLIGGVGALGFIRRRKAQTAAG